MKMFFATGMPLPENRGSSFDCCDQRSHRFLWTTSRQVSFLPFNHWFTATSGNTRRDRLPPSERPYKSSCLQLLSATEGSECRPDVRYPHNVSPGHSCRFSALRPEFCTPGWSSVFFHRFQRRYHPGCSQKTDRWIILISGNCRVIHKKEPLLLLP